jgi:hypothetical protein
VSQSATLLLAAAGIRYLDVDLETRDSETTAVQPLLGQGCRDKAGGLQGRGGESMFRAVLNAQHSLKALGPTVSMFASFLGSIRCVPNQQPPASPPWQDALLFDQKEEESSCGAAAQQRPYEPGTALAAAESPLRNDCE